MPFGDGLFFPANPNPPRTRPRAPLPVPKTSPQTHINPQSVVPTARPASNPSRPKATDPLSRGDGTGLNVEKTRRPATSPVPVKDKPKTTSQVFYNRSKTFNSDSENRPKRGSMSVIEEHELKNRLRHLYTLAKREKSRHYQRWTRNYKLVNNQFTTPTNSWAPYPRDSEIYPTVAALVAWMTDQNTLIDCTPVADPHSPFYDFISKVAEDLSLVIYSTWENENFYGQIQLTLWDTFLYGAGIFKNVWDNSLDDGYGNAVIRRVDPYTFYPDPTATSLLDCEYMIEVRRMSFNEIERRFPNKSAELEARSSFEANHDNPRPSLTGDVNPNDPPNLGALPDGDGRWANNRSSSRRQSTMPLITVYEYWLRENSLEEEDYSDLPEEDRPELAEAHCKDKWRCVIVANDTILFDEYAEDLWDGGWQPYERYVFDDIGEFYGIALVDHLAYPQIYLNRLLMALQHNTELTGNPVFVSPTNSGISRVGVVNKPGQRLNVNPASMAIGQGPHWIDPPSMPAQVMQLIDFWISRIENTSGLSAIVRGATPTARNSQGVISSIQEAAFVRIRAGLRNLEKALEACTIKLADLISEFYTEARTMAVIGPDGQQSAKVLQARHFYGPTEKGGSPLKFLINVQAGSSTPTSRQARIAEADALFAMGSLDRRSLLEAHQYPHIDEIMKRINEGIADGTFNPPGARQRTQRTS